MATITSPSRPAGGKGLFSRIANAALNASSAYAAAADDVRAAEADATYARVTGELPAGSRLLDRRRARASRRDRG